MGGWGEREVKLLADREKWEQSLLGGLVMEAQHRGGQLMQLEDPPNPTMIEGDGVTGLHNPGEFSGGEGIRQGETDDLVLDMEQHTDVDKGRAARMR
jgi:hypothetical protein